MKKKKMSLKNISIYDLEVMLNPRGNTFLDKMFPKGIAQMNAKYALTHPHRIVSFMFLEIKWAWQRVFRGWDDTVVWSLDTYLAKNICVWLEELKKDKAGVPSNIYSQYEDGEDGYRLALEEYRKILDEIICGFDDYVKAVEEMRKYDKKKLKESFRLLEENFETLWD